MQLVEQLRLKKTEAKSRLLFRKRKLSELYSVTADQYSKPQDHNYGQKLQEFQAANDLERGRFFDESTLPPRPQIYLHTRKSQPSQSTRSVTRNLSNLERHPSPSKADSLLTPETTQKHSAGSPPPSRLRHHSTPPNDLRPTPDKYLNVKVAARDGLDGLRSPISPTRDAIEPSIKSPGNTHERRTRSPANQTSTLKGIESDLGEERRELDNGNSPIEEKLRENKTSNETGRQSRSPSMEAAGSTIGENHSSPASTSAHGSSNTPAATAGSPETSPGDEVPTATSGLFERSQTFDPNNSKEQEKSAISEAAQSNQVPRPSPLSAAMDMSEDRAQSADVTGSTESTKQMTQEHDRSSNQKQPMRIDTQSEITSYFNPRSGSDVVESPVQIFNAVTPRRTSAITPTTQESSKRATRISSGVLQKKSVSEILGEIPKPISPAVEPLITTNLHEDPYHSSSQDRLTDRERRDKVRSKLSTVVFTKPQKLNGDDDTIELTMNHPTGPQRTKAQDRDYLYTLFENKAYSMTRHGNLSYLIQNAHKTLSTTDHLIDYELQAECRILKRLYQLQEKQRWALRQYKRADEAPRPTFHWDFVLDHVKWLRTDFREERKWKLAAARGLADCCAEWVASTPEVRKSLQIRMKAPRNPGENEHESPDVIMEDGPGPALSSQTTPDLMSSNDDDAVSEDLAEPIDLAVTAAPAAIFSLGASDFNFTADKTPAFDKLLNELPLYEPARIEPELTNSKLAEKLDARWKTDIIPVSRYAVEKINVREYHPPVKRSRYEYELEPSTRKVIPLPPQETNVALFMPENKHIRDRIHPGHSFRPPSEHPMPTQAFFETRSSSQWTQGEDDELRKLVKDYSYNWSLISSCLSPRTLYSSGADRRSPWECFERWIGLEGLPADMSKTPYFKTYSGRIEAAGRHVAAQIEEVRNRAGVNIPLAVRKRPTQPIRVERKRAQRHLAMLDAMRKLAKKRESALQKQQHQADLAAMRKVNEVAQPKVQYHTPAEFARLKQDREQKVAERHELIRQNLLAQQRALAQQQRGHNAQVNGMTNGLPSNGAGMRGPTSATGMSGMPNGGLQVPNGHARPHPAMMGPGGMSMPPGMVGPNGIAQAQAQMQANMARAAGNSPQQMRMLQDVSKVQQEQAIRQAQMQNGMHSSPNGAHASLGNSKGSTHQAFMAAMAAATGGQSSSIPLNGNAGSPRSQNTKPGQALSSGHVPVLTQLANQIREIHPNLPEEEVQRQASFQIRRWQQETLAAAAGHATKRPQPHNQAAVNAAMGAVNAAAAAAAQYGQNAMMTNEQVLQYQQRMRQQQAQQHAARGMPGQMQQGMMGGMTNSPVMTMARPVSQHTNQSQMSRSVTPRDQRSGSQGTITGSGGAPQGSPRSGSQVVQT